MFLPCYPVALAPDFEAFVLADLACATGHAFDLAVIEQVFNHD